MTFRVYSPISQCNGKRPFATKADAKRAARAAERSLGRMRAYRCPHCSTNDEPIWHVGHKPPPWTDPEIS